MSENRRSKTIDLAARKTEEDWFQMWVGLSEDMPTLWFNWMRWIFVLAIISYIAEQTGSYVFKGLEVISYTLLVFHFQFFFMSFDIKQHHNWIVKQTKKWQKALAIIPAAILSVGFFALTSYVVRHAIEVIKLQQ